jgi:hypothetical protein
MKKKKQKATVKECENCNAGEFKGKGCMIYKGYECWLARRKYKYQKDES